MKAIVKIDVPEEYIGQEVDVCIPNKARCEMFVGLEKVQEDIVNIPSVFTGKIEEDKNIAHWNCLDNYGGQVNGFECSKCKMPSKEDTEFCSSCGRWMVGDK